MDDPAVRLWWEASGPPDAASTIVLIPDAQRPAAYWPTELVDGLIERGWRVVRLDLRDQGRSPWVSESYTVADLVADVAGLGRQATSGRPAHLLGHGLGGTLALHVALDHARLVSGLTVVGATGWLVDPTLPGPEEPVAVGLIWRTRMGEGEADRLVRAIARELRLAMVEADDVGGPAAVAEVERWLAWGFNPHDTHRRAWLEAPGRWDDLRELSMPLNVVHGRRDPLVPLAHGVRLARTVPLARMIEVEDAGHALTPQQVDAVLSAVGAADEPPSPAGGGAAC